MTNNCQQCGAEIPEDFSEYTLYIKRSCMRVENPHVFIGDEMLLCENCINEICALFRAWLENDSALRSVMGWKTEGHQVRTIEDLLRVWRERWERENQA